MKRLRKRDRKFLLLVGGTALLILVFFLAGYEVARVVGGGSRKVDAERIEALIQEGELSAEEAKFNRPAEAGEETAP